MGVLNCSRPDCPHIMCDTYVSGIGYVCNECRKEFEDYLQTECLSPNTEGEIKNELKKFMATDKGKYEKGKEMTLNEFFKQYDRHN